MTVSHGVEGQLISEARTCIYRDIKALSYSSFQKRDKELSKETHIVTTIMRHRNVI